MKHNDRYLHVPASSWDNTLNKREAPKLEIFLGDWGIRARIIGMPNPESPPTSIMIDKSWVPDIIEHLQRGEWNGNEA